MNSRRDEIVFAPKIGGCVPQTLAITEREFVVENLLVRIHFIIVMMRWTGLAPWEVECLLLGSLTSTFLARQSSSALLISRRPAAPGLPS